MQLNRVSWLWLLPALLLLFWLGARGLNADSFWFDEYWSVYNAGGAHYGPLSPLGIWERVSTQDPWQAPSFFYALAGWGALVGWTEFATRALSLLAGVLAIAWMYRLGRSVISPFGGLAAALLVGGSAYLLFFFHELRTYTLVILFTGMTAWAYWRVARRGGGRRAQAALVIGAALLLYTHYFAALSLGALSLYHLLFVRKDRRWWRVTLLLGTAGLLFLPWLGVLLTGMSSAVEDTLRQASAWTPRQSVQGVLFMFSNGSAVVLLLLLILSIQRRRAALFAWFWLLLLLGALLLINARFGVILEVRYLLPLWPALGLAAALGVERLARRGDGLAVLLLGLWLAAGAWNSLDSASAWTLQNPHWHLPWRELRGELRPHVQDGDELVFLLPDWTWPSYHQLPFEHYLYGLPVRGALLERPENLGDAEYARRAAEIGAGASRFWLAWAAEQPTTHVERFRREHNPALLHCGSLSASPAVSLELYSAGLPDFEQAVFDAEGAITLNSLDAQFMPDRRTLSVTAIWSRHEAVPLSTYSVALHVDDAAGTLVAQQDYGLPDEARACRSIDLPLDGLPAGEYRLYAIVYAWESGARLNGARAGAVGERLLVANFSIP
ncbi:MAG: glycosyltransferase family 39 protein [Anaerolineae bacterium]|nr:glycosyltransferase family 39 protein [Anaerolineae bacterium]